MKHIFGSDLCRLSFLPYPPSQKKKNTKILKELEKIPKTKLVIINYNRCSNCLEILERHVRIMFAQTRFSMSCYCVSDSQEKCYIFKKFILCIISLIYLKFHKCSYLENRSIKLCVTSTPQNGMGNCLK